MDSFYPRNQVDDDRRQMILRRLEQERELRRKHVKDGTIDQFKLEDITNYSNSQSQQNMYYSDSTQMFGMKDPTEILLNPNSEEVDPNEDISYQVPPTDSRQRSFDNQYMMSYPQNVNNNCGFNPESLYNENMSENQIYLDRNNRITTNIYNTQEYQIDEDKLRETKQRFHERLSKHRFVSNSGAKKWNRDNWTENSNPNVQKGESKIKPGIHQGYMNPTLSREITLADKGKVRNEAKKIMIDAENKIMEHWSFKPEISPFDNPDDSTTQEERWRRLLEPKTSKIQKLEKTKIEIERKKIEETCSFQPKIQKPPHPTPHPESSKDVVKRLHSEANKRIEKREKLKRKFDEERMKDWSFKPKIEKDNKIGTARSSSQKPLYERVEEVQKKKNDTLVKLRVESELNDKNLKFKPQVNK